jgi:hypothetical protein
MLTLLLAAALAAGPGGSLSLTREPPSAELGGVLAPAALGAGSLAVYGLVGAPEVAVGFRQGFSTFELEARASFDLFQAAGVLEGGIKVPVLRAGNFLLAVGGLLGVKLDSGARYADPANFASIALQPRAVAAASLEASEAVALLARLDVPLAVSLTGPGVEFRPTLGAGAELRLGPGFSLLVLGQLGVDLLQPPAGQVVSRLAWGLQFGVGYRVF